MLGLKPSFERKQWHLILSAQRRTPNKVNHLEFAKQRVEQYLHCGPFSCKQLALCAVYCISLKLATHETFNSFFQIDCWKQVAKANFVKWRNFQATSSEYPKIVLIDSRSKLFRSGLTPQYKPMNSNQLYATSLYFDNIRSISVKLQTIKIVLEN